MCDVELPQLVLAAELGALSEDLLHHRVVLHVPVYPRLLRVRVRVGVRVRVRRVVRSQSSPGWGEGEG